jgi:hypothetical protein
VSCAEAVNVNFWYLAHRLAGTGTANRSFPLTPPIRTMAHFMTLFLPGIDLYIGIDCALSISTCDYCRVTVCTKFVLRSDVRAGAEAIGVFPRQNESQ